MQVIAQHDQIPHVVVGIKAPGGAGDQKAFDAHRRHEPNRPRDALEVMALVTVQSAGSGEYHRSVVDLAGDQSSGVTVGGRSRQVQQVGGFDLGTDPHPRRDRPQSRAQHHAEPGAGEQRLPPRRFATQSMPRRGAPRLFGLPDRVTLCDD